MSSSIPSSSSSSSTTPGTTTVKESKNQGDNSDPKKNHKNNNQDDLFVTIFGVVDAVVELYLTSVIQPFLKLHETFYTALNKLLRSMLDNNSKHIPEWFTANFITYFRTVMVIPCICLLSKQYVLIPSIIVVLVDFGDFLDGVVARYWVDRKQQRQEEEKKTAKTNNNETSATDDEFEVVTSGSPVTIPSWEVQHRNRSYGGFVDAVCDKAFVVPCWITLLHTAANTGFLQTLQYLVLICLIVAEVASGCIRFRAYFTSGGVPAPKVEGLDFSTSAVKADHVGKAKQTFEMVGTALYIVPLSRYVGFCLLFFAVPLAYESVRRKVKKRVIYVVVDSNNDSGSAAATTTTGGGGGEGGIMISSLDHKVLRFWMQAKAMGSKLIIGIPGKKQTDMILNACAATCVDEVIVEAPEKADLMFLEKQTIDYVVFSGATTGQSQFVTDEVINANCCLSLGEDGVARPMMKKSKLEEKQD